MNCEQIRQSLSAHLDNELPPSEASAVSAHLAGCPGCAAELDGLKRASRMVRDLPLKPLPLGFLTRLRAKADAGAAAPAVSWLGPRPLAFAAAAIVAGLVIAGPWRSQRLARAPGGPIGAAVPEPAELPALKTMSAPPAPAAAPAPAVPAPQAPKIAGADEAAAIEKAKAAADAFTAAQYGKGPSAPGAATGAMRGAAKLDMPAPGEKKAAGAPFGSPQPYSNEELHEMLEKESREEGIKGSARELEADEDKPDTSFMGAHLGLPGSRERSNAAIRQLQAMRRQIEESSGKPAQVPIAGTMAPVLGSGGAYGAGGGLAGPGEAIEGPAKPLAEGFWSGDYAAGNEGTRTVEDEETWSSLWRTLSTTPPPSVDFSRSMVVAVFLGPRPTGGYAVEFSETKRLAHSLVVRWRERAPEPGMSPPDGATSPYALKVLPKSDAPVRFEKTR
jgi:anti-sigma factor RsiW